MKFFFTLLISLPFISINAQHESYQDLLDRAHQSFAISVNEPTLWDIDNTIRLFEELIMAYPNDVENLRENLYLAMLYFYKKEMVASKQICQKIYQSPQLEAAYIQLDEAEQWMVWTLFSFHFIENNDCDAVLSFKNIWDEKADEYQAAFKGKYADHKKSMPIICGENQVYSSMKTLAKYQKCIGDNRLAIQYLSLYFYLQKKDILTLEGEQISQLNDWISETYTTEELEKALDNFDLENIKLESLNNRFAAKIQFLDVKLWIHYDDQNQLAENLSEADLKQWYFEKMKKAEWLKNQ